MMAIDLFCGLGGWTEGLLDTGYEVIGFDIEDHRYGNARYPAQLVLQDVRTLHGNQFRDARLIVASPPCQEYSYMAMPWSKAKARAAEYRSGERDVKKLTELFDTCFRIQLEACEAAGRHIPMVVENVRGAQNWVSHAQWHYGSYYLWGDVPALMPIPPKTGQKVPGFRFDGSGKSFQTASVAHMSNGTKVPGLSDGRFPPGGLAQGAINNLAYKSSGMNWSDRNKKGQDFTRVAGAQAVKNPGGSWFRSERNDPRDNPPHTLHMTNPAEHIKCGGDWFSKGSNCSTPRRQSSRGISRKAASAMIAKIPYTLSKYIGEVYARSRP